MTNNTDNNNHEYNDLAILVYYYNGTNFYTVAGYAHGTPATRLLLDASLLAVFAVLPFSLFVFAFQLS